MALSTKLPWELAQTKWPAELNPVLANPILAGQQIDNIVVLATKTKAVSHGLGRLPQGWFLVDNTQNAVIWRSQPMNKTVIYLDSSADTIISIWVY